MFGIFKRKPPVERRVLITERDVLRLRLHEWRSSPDLCQAARRALSDQAVRHMLDVTRNEHLAHYTNIGAMSLEERAVQHARAEGYGLALNNLESMGNLIEPEERIEETFERPEPAEAD